MSTSIGTNALVWRARVARDRQDGVLARLGAQVDNQMLRGWVRQANDHLLAPVEEAHWVSLLSSHVLQHGV
jgi:hypothetical protein